MPKDRKIDPATIEGKNAGPTGCVLMVDANRESLLWYLPPFAPSLSFVAPLVTYTGSGDPDR